MGRSNRIDSALDGVLILALNIPALVTIILCYIWFGLTEAAVIVAVALNKIPTVVVTIREGARAVDRDLMQVADVFRIDRFKTLRRVYLPQGTDAKTAGELRGKGWITVAGLGAVEDPAAEALRQRCGHVLIDGKPQPVG